MARSTDNRQAEEWHNSHRQYIEEDWEYSVETTTPTVEYSAKVARLRALQFPPLSKIKQYKKEPGVPIEDAPRYHVTDSWTEYDNPAFLCFIGSYNYNNAQHAVLQYNNKTYKLGKALVLRYLKHCLYLLSWKSEVKPGSTLNEIKPIEAEAVLHRKEVLRYYYKANSGNLGGKESKFLQMMHEIKPSRNFYPTRTVDNLVVDRDSSGPNYRMINHFYIIEEVRFGFYESWLTKEAVRRSEEVDMTPVLYGGKVLDKNDKVRTVWPRDLSHMHFTVAMLRRSTTPLALFLRPRIKSNSRGLYYRLTKELYLEFLDQLVLAVPPQFRALLPTGYIDADDITFVPAEADLMASAELEDLEKLLEEQDEDDDI